MNSTAAFIIWVIIEMIIIFLVLLLILATKILLVKDYPLTTSKLDYDSFKTGDIIGVSYTNPFGWFVTGWSNSIWSHIGVVWRDPNTNYPYVLEAANYGKNYDGLITVPLNEWFRINKRNIIGYMSINISPDSEKMMTHFESLKKYGLDTYNINWIRLIQKQLYDSDKFDKPNCIDNKTRYVCYELSIMMLQNVGVVEKKLMPSSYFPRDIMYGKLPLINNYQYSSTVLIDTQTILNISRVY
jgi:hypothetical protein